jgi:hypothetical protein
LNNQEEEGHKASCIKEALQKFSAIWKPEAEAIRIISIHWDLSEFNHSIFSKFKIIKMGILQKLFNHNAIVSAKREDMSYVDALRYETFVEGCIKSICCILMCSLAFYLFIYTKSLMIEV